jgi:hypothetical protein
MLVNFSNWITDSNLDDLASKHRIWNTVHVGIGWPLVHKLVVRKLCDES